MCLLMLPRNEVCILFPSIHLLVSLFPVICFELPITGTFFNFPKRSVVGHGSGGAGGASVPPPPHFCRIINNFLIFYHGQLLRTKNTILESSSKRRLDRLFKRRNKVLSRLDWDVSFFYPHSIPHPLTSLWKAILCSFVAGTIEDCILGDQDVVDVLIKRPSIIAYNWWCWCGRGGGVWEKMDSPILF